ncbi:hypothetical protein D3C75_1295980 [compost metagenome]
MSWQRIYLGDSEEGGNYGRTYRTTGTHEVAILVRLFHKTLRNQIVGRETKFNNRRQLFFQPGNDDLRQFLTID